MFHSFLFSEGRNSVIVISDYSLVNGFDFSKFHFLYRTLTFHTKIILIIIRGISKLSQGTYVLQNFTDEGLIFCQLGMHNHFHVIRIEERIISKRKRPFSCFAKKRKMNLNAVSKIRSFLFKIFMVSTNMVKIKIQLS